MVNGQWSTAKGQWSTVNGQGSMVNGQWSTANGQRPMVNGQRSMNDALGAGTGAASGAGNFPVNVWLSTTCTQVLVNYFFVAGRATGIT